MSALSILPGTNTSCGEVTSIGSRGFWLLIDDTEYFVPFADYPVFREARVDQIFDVQCLAPGQLHWPDLDADIEVEALGQPERYPLIWRD